MTNQMRVYRSGVDVDWLKSIKPEEEQRLMVLAARKMRRKQTDAEEDAEVRKIMDRCIKRRRRQKGKRT